MSAEGNRPNVTVEELRAQLRKDPDGFLKSLDKLLSSCTDEKTGLFWSAMKKFAERSSNR